MLTTATAPAQDAQQRLFQRVFGQAAQFDSATVAKVKALKPGEPLLLDSNADGKHDEYWFIDTSPRHQQKVRPLLVRVVDEDGDLDSYKGPDLDSDLYVADWTADGSVDAVIDYADTDADGDLDEMAMYFFMAHHPFFGNDVLRVWWSRDDGDDNLLWYDENYTYDQDRCQYRCHFSGDETFVAFGLTEGGREWVSAYENPFLFYDVDDDLCSEVVLRIEGKADAIRAIRYSFDADDDAYGRRTHDYDFSITARADENQPVTIPPELLEATKLRGIPTQGWLRRDKARGFVESAPWSKAMLTWDELNANTEQDFAKDPNERWEGVIAHGNNEFKQVGGPPCSLFNKRYELSLSPKPPLRLFPGSDGRLHLDGASKGWLDVDYNLDGRLDSRYTWSDEDADGRFDRQRLDVDADGKVDWERPVALFRPPHLPLDYADEIALEARQIWFRSAGVVGSPGQSQDFVLTADAVRGPAPTDPVAAFFRGPLASVMPEQQLGARIRASESVFMAGAAFYAGLARDRAFLKLKRRIGQEPVWPELESLYAAGKYRPASDLLRKQFPDSPWPELPRQYGDFTKRLLIQVHNEQSVPLVNRPLGISVEHIRRYAPDFNPGNCAVATTPMWLGVEPVPHQVCEPDPRGGPVLMFSTNQRANSGAGYWLYYSPEGSSRPAFEKRTATAQDWVPPNIGWESGRAAYRAYWGQFDFFGKRTEQLIYPTIGAKSYHEETEWGIDALLVGKTSGLGGLTLYHQGRPYPVQNPAGEGQVTFEKRVLTEGPCCAVVEILAGNIIPDSPEVKVRIQCASFADRQETQITVRVEGCAGAALLAPGLMKLPREQVVSDAKEGYFGAWGFQDKVIGDIGMGLIFDPAAFKEVLELPEERRVVLSTSNEGILRYWLIGDWRRGRQYPIAPTANNWRAELRHLAGLLLNPPSITIGKPEEMRTENWMPR